jgi:RNase H-fold protein (predicted Holliday junction resolvase)
LPAAVVQTQKLDSALESLMLDYTIKILVIGLPLSANRAENHICVIIRILADKLQKKFPKVSVQLVNERFSSQAVMSPDNKRIDDLAAMQILDFYLAQSKK